MFFVGLFLAIFVGMGIAVFYQAPSQPQEPTAMSYVGKDGPTAAQQQEIDTFNAQQRAFGQAMMRYNRNVSIIVLVIAVIILAIALIFAEKLGIIANGILLGGIFTLLYGIGRGMASDSNKFRFIVAAVGLAVTLFLGYTRFVNQQTAAKHQSPKRQRQARG